MNNRESSGEGRRQRLKVDAQGSHAVPLNRPWLTSDLTDTVELAAWVLMEGNFSERETSQRKGRPVRVRPDQQGGHCGRSPRARAGGGGRGRGGGERGAGSRQADGQQVLGQQRCECRDEGCLSVRVKEEAKE